MGKRRTLLLMASLMLAACGPAASITADAANATALREAGSTVPPQVLSTKLSTYAAEARGGQIVDPATPVWAVVVSGSWPSSCGPVNPVPNPCPPPATTALVLVNARTGAFIQAQMPAP